MMRQLWLRLPVAARAVILGILVAVAGSTPVTSITYANIRLLPTVPWSVPLAGIWLWLFWRYAGGRYPPRATAAARRQLLRAEPLPASIWRWSLLAGGLGIAGSLAAQSGLARVTTMGYGMPEILRTVPPLTLLAMLLSLSAMAGIVEEAAWRGYMQGPIERRHGPVAAIALVSVLFGLAHLSDQQPGMTALRMLFILTAGVFYGTLTHVTGSIVPGVVIHGAGDILGAGLIWRRSLAESATGSTAAPGPDTPFWWLLVTGILLIAAGFGLLRPTASNARRPW